MTYEQKVNAVINRLDSDGADSEREWAENILRSIGITAETPNGTTAITNAVVLPPSDPNQDLIEAQSERNS